MATPLALHHSLLRPAVLQILRAAGYQATRPSVLDSLTDLAAAYMTTLVRATASHAHLDDSELDITIEHIRKAMQDCGALLPEKTADEQEFEGREDMRGVDAFIDWAKGPANREIRRIALEGAEGAKEDYLAVLKKKHSTADGDLRYHGTILGKPTETRAVKVEGGSATSIKDWADLQKKQSSAPPTVQSSRAQSSALSTIGDQSMSDIDMDFMS